LKAYSNMLKKIKVISVTEKGIKPVVSLTTSTNTFIANNILHHNCSSCNRIHEENILPHTQAMLQAYGAERVDGLNVRWQVSKQKAKSFSRAEKLEMIEQFEKEL